MAHFETLTVTLVRPARLHEDDDVIVRHVGTTLVFKRDDISYASWLACCQHEKGETFTILMRIC